MEIGPKKKSYLGPQGKEAIGSKWIFKVKLKQDGSIDRYKACLVVKSITLEWNIELTSKIESYGFKQSPYDHCLFTLRSSSIFLALIVYVDDVLLTANSVAALDEVKHYLDDLFTIKDFSHAEYFLRLELARSSHGTYVTQCKYLLDIVHDCRLEDAKSPTTPLPAGVKFDNETGSLLPPPDRYRRLVGRLLYLGFSCLDISFVVKQLSQFVQQTRQPHWEAALHLVHYLRGTPTLGLFFPTDSSFQLTAYFDSDCASCIESRLSTTCYYIFFGGSLVPWKTKKQTTVFGSSAEAEYRSMGTIVCELLWNNYLLQDFGIPIDSAIPFHHDNKAAIHITDNHVFHESTKHLDIDCHLVRNHFKCGFIRPHHIPSAQQVANLFTKALPIASFSRLLSKLGMVSHALT
ncbi:UNVERIFIED_CONTAM: hypothetical protein Sangu_1182900 [Sesamum angustifolium]|uniref:Reverse transcriptase Ty1/copia-type domain-containing protein n=1 Tax=Sesamum angustifolium TaxID=2727405 RepID=A0AAW2NJH3_9LAMI